jgi:transposase
MTGDAFLVYVEKVLVPTLSPGDTVIIDNLASHKVAGVREAIEAVGAKLLYLPPYSPDLNPIELAFAKFKTGLRKAAERTVDDLWRRIGALIHDFSPQECQNFFCHDGYPRWFQARSARLGRRHAGACGFVPTICLRFAGSRRCICP